MPERLLKLPEVKHLTTLSRSAIYAEIAHNRFPQQVRIGPRSVAWHESEIQQWITRRTAESRPTPVPTRGQQAGQQI